MYNKYMRSKMLVLLFCTIVITSLFYQCLQDSCHCFWPHKSEVAGMDGAEEVYGKLTVTLKRQSVYGDVTEWKLEVTDNEEKISTSQRMVTLLQLTSWSMDELPHSSSILSLIDLLGKAQRSSPSRHTVIMCR